MILIPLVFAAYCLRGIISHAFFKRQSLNEGKRTLIEASNAEIAHKKQSAARAPTCSSLKRGLPLRSAACISSGSTETDRPCFAHECPRER